MGNYFSGEVESDAVKREERSEKEGFVTITKAEYGKLNYERGARHHSKLFPIFYISI